jgi:hypothetical protein
LPLIFFMVKKTLAAIFSIITTVIVISLLRIYFNETDISSFETFNIAWKNELTNGLIITLLLIYLPFILITLLFKKQKAKVLMVCLLNGFESYLIGFFFYFFLTPYRIRIEFNIGILLIALVSILFPLINIFFSLIIDKVSKAKKSVS